MTSRPSQIVFGTDGWRGLIDEEMNRESVGLVAQAFCDYLRRKGCTQGVAVGYDGRMHSSDFAALFARVTSGNGLEVFLSDAVVPTPILSYFVRANKLAAGVMITASHNPPQYNGVKFKAEYGGPFFTEETRKVEELIGKTAVRENSGAIKTLSFLQPYIEQIERFINLDAIGKAGLSVLVDSMGGAGQRILETILSRAGNAVRTIQGKPATDFFGRSPEPIAKNLSPLIEELQQNNSIAVGVATDGDGDRLGVVMNGGRWLSAQETILLLTDHIIHTRRAPGNIVKTASVTEKVRKIFEGAGRIVYDVQVGFKHICEKMIAEQVAIGCEESGGFGFGGHIPERDGIVSALLLLEAMAGAGVANLSELVEKQRNQFGPVYYDRVDMQYPGTDRASILPLLLSHSPLEIAGFRIQDIERFDSSRGIVNGLKFTFEGSSRWLLLRASETEPVVRIYSEGESGQEVASFLRAGQKLFMSQT